MTPAESGPPAHQSGTAVPQEHVIGRFRQDLSSGSWWWSGGLWELFGYPSAGSAPTTDLFLERLPEDARQTVREALAETARTGVAFTWSGKACRLDGATPEITVVGERDVGDDGRPLSVSGCVLNLTLGKNDAAATAWPIAGTSRSAEAIRRLQQELLLRHPPQAWPEPLCVAINLCLEADVPACVLWGPTLVQFYNDAYADAIVGDQARPIGATVADNWPEIWDRLRPHIWSVQASGTALTRTSEPLSIVRGGRLTEQFFDYSITPLRARDGSIGGVFCIVLDSTADRIASRRSSLLREVSALCGGPVETQESLLTTMTTLAGNPNDIPFAAVYSVDSRDRSATRAAEHGLDVESWARCDERVFPDGSARHLHEGLTGQSTGLVDLTGIAPRLFTAPWPEPVEQAALVALPSGDRGGDELLLVGLSPRLEYDSRYREFTEHLAQEVGSLLAAARALHAAEEKISHLQVALTSNRRIGAAMGVLMAFRKVDEEQAFDLLKQTSQRTRRKLYDIAEEVTRTGDLPS